MSSAFARKLASHRLVPIAFLLTLPGLLGTAPALRLRITIESPQPLHLATPLAWTTAHGTATNDALLRPTSRDSSPQYHVRTPWLWSSSPVLAAGHLFVAATAPTRQPDPPGALVAIQARTGRVLWRVHTPNAVDSQPVVAQGRVFLGIGNAVFQSRAPFPLPATLPGTHRGTGPSAIWAVSVATGHILWRLPTLGSDQPTPTIIRGTLYTATGAGAFLAINPVTGHVRWRIAIGMFVSRSSPRIDGSLAILGGGGPEQVIAINLRTHRIAWRTVFPRAVGGLDDTPLAIAHGLVIGEALIGNPHQSILAPHTQVLFALRATTGQRVWETPLAVGPEPRYKQGATPTIAGRTVYVGSVVAPGLWAVQRTTGQIRWHIASDSPIPRPPLVWGSHVWAVTTAGTLLRTTRAGYPVFPMTLGRWANVFGPIIVGSTWAITGNTVDAGILQVRPWTRFLVSQPTRQPGSHA